MIKLLVRIPDRPPLVLGEDLPEITVGRSSDNTLILDEASLSRFHARLFAIGDAAFVEDLHSRNGTLLNNTLIQGVNCLLPGDELTFGLVRVTLEAWEPAERAEPTVSIQARVDDLRSLRSAGPDPEAPNPWKDALGMVHALSVAMLADTSPEVLLADLLERLYHFLKPGRGVVLLKNAAGELTQVAARCATPDREFQVKLSRTMLKAALEGREALLINNPLQDARLANAASLMFSNITSIMTVPLEHENEVVGIVYLDAGPARLPFTEEDLRLVAILGHLAAAKIRTARLNEEVAAKRVMEKELAVARQIQERILPDHLPAMERMELFAHNTPCRQVSGDLYGFWTRPDGKVWLAVADVSGKGVGPGLLMATFQAYMEIWTGTGMGPAALARMLSLALSRRTSPNRFITACLVLVDPRDGSLIYTNAGHNPILVLRADGSHQTLESQGFPLAMFAGGDYGEAPLTLGPGDLLVMYTDGITEAVDTEGNEFDLDTLRGHLEQMGPLPLPELHQGLCRALEQHAHGTPLGDDQTILFLRRQP